MNRCIIAIFFLVVVSACNSGKTDEAATRKDAFSDKPISKEDSLLKEVLEGHDIGMARMGKIAGNLKKIQTELDSMAKLAPKAVNKEYQQALVDLQAALNDAEYGMNAWMEGFKLDTLTDNSELRIKYLENEKKIVGVVKEKILTSLAKADSLLQKK